MSTSVVGRSLRKVDGFKLVTGGAAFTDDVQLPGLLYGKILPSPYAHARIRRIDASKAKALAGVHAVLTYKDVPRVPHTTAGQAWPEPSPYDTYLLDSKVRFVGDRVAAVAAESRAIAEEALRLIHVDYEILPAVLDMEAAMETGTPIIHDEPDSTNIFDRDRNLAGHILREIGNVDDAFREADYIFEREYRTQRQQHAMLEPHVTICWLDADGRLVIRTSTQVPYHCRRQVAMILQIPEAQLTRPVEPGDTLWVEAEVLKLGERLGELRGTIFRAGEKVAEGKVRFAIVEAAQLRIQDSGSVLSHHKLNRFSCVRGSASSKLSAM